MKARIIKIPRRSRGYYVDTAGKNAKKIQEYIQRQLEEDNAGEQLTMGNF